MESQPDSSPVARSPEPAGLVGGDSSRRVAAGSVPVWAVPKGSREDPIEAAYKAGAALDALDRLVRSDPPWAGAWRQRLALKAAAAAAPLVGRREDEAALRDAWHLCRAGDDPGPGGNLVNAWRRLATRAASLDVETLRTLLPLLGSAWSDAFATIPEILAEAARSEKPAPAVAAFVAGEVAALGPETEALAWWLADGALARSLRWRVPVPILATQIHAPCLRAGRAGRRLRPGDEGFEPALYLAAAAGAAEACRIAGEMARRADRLAAAAPKLRSKGAGEVIRRLLEDDAVSGSLTTRSSSRWASRRLFERLSALGAVRELSGRASFKLYGL
jgi:hypothetical protein